MSIDSLPNNMSKLRACLGCSMIKTFDQFLEDGCENCNSFLNMKNDPHNVHLLTSRNFSGMAGIMQPTDSWVCKWLRIGKCVPGMYALSVSGSLPSGIISDCKQRGIILRSRDRAK